ncbi:MAG TPA: AmmeMemoRadiSam system protein B [Candidatus Limnocylindrales bacterium]
MTRGPRRPAVAGTFYPADPRRLSTLLAGLLAEAAATPRPAGLSPGDVAGLLVPHAGLEYSGAIAALAWALAGEIGPATIVLAGTDHQARADGIGVWAGGPWQTPLGDVPVDAELADEIAALGLPFVRNDSAHAGEHSLEVQLPLLLSTCHGARIVPLAVSPLLATHKEAGRALGLLLARKREAGERILLVASSDMAHYPPAGICEKVDTEMLEPLLRMDVDELHLREARFSQAGRYGIVCGMCGIDPVRVALSALAEMGARQGILLKAATSADAGGDPRRTVGYAAAAFE